MKEQSARVGITLREYLVRGSTFAVNTSMSKVVEFILISDPLNDTPSESNMS